MNEERTFTQEQIEEILVDFAEWMNCHEVTYGKYANDFYIDGEFIGKTSRLVEKYTEGRDW